MSEIQPYTGQAQWTVLKQESAAALRSGFLPKSIDTLEKALAIAMVGRELGITPWRALTGITVIRGKPTLGSELMASLIFQHHGPDALIFEESTEQGCTISYLRKGAKERKSYTYSMEMAKKAGLATSETYQKHPASMLRARCISSIARMAFPDTIAGCYETGEMEQVQAEETAPPLTIEDETHLPAPKNWLDKLEALRQEYLHVSGDMLPAADSGITRGEARARKQGLELMIAAYDPETVEGTATVIQEAV